MAIVYFLRLGDYLGWYDAGNGLHLPEICKRRLVIFQRGFIEVQGAFIVA
jgi:hypothetical protein